MSAPEHLKESRRSFMKNGAIAATKVAAGSVPENKQSSLRREMPRTFSPPIHD